MNSLILKRLNHEYDDIVKKYKYCQIIIGEDFDKIKNDTINLKYPKFKMVVLVDNVLLKFIFTKNYPFSPPKLYINNNNYSNMLCLKGDLYSQLFKKMDINCLCCNSFFCNNNWSPAKKIIDIIEEYKYNKKIITNVIYKKHIKQILESKNILALEIYEKICCYL